jgi:WD40 repeat protein
MLASGSDDQTIRLWGVNDGQCLHALSGHTGRIYSVAFSPDDNSLASGSEDQSIRLWEISTGQCLCSLMGHGSRVRSVVFNAAGTILASGSHDGTVKLWNRHTGYCTQTLRSDQPYERMNITGIKGVTPAQKAMLKTLGAIENL